MNWGHKLMLVFVAFAAMMSYLAYRAFKTEFELVDKDYYKNELTYQQVIDGINRANTLHSQPAIKQNGNEILLQMPDEMRNKNLSGSIFFYCPSDSKKDRKFSLSVNDEGRQSFQDLLKPGYYVVKVDWVNDKKNYYTEKHITIL
jgi:nitrogen fixation protein FixH